MNNTLVAQPNQTPVSSLRFQEKKQNRNHMTWKMNMLDEKEGLLLVCFMVIGRKCVT